MGKWLSNGGRHGMLAPAGNENRRKQSAMPKGIVSAKSEKQWRRNGRRRQMAGMAKSEMAKATATSDGGSMAWRESWRGGGVSASVKKIISGIIN
jgi:hypothetical protein